MTQQVVPNATPPAATPSGSVFERVDSRVAALESRFAGEQAKADAEAPESDAPTEPASPGALRGKPPAKEPAAETPAPADDKLEKIARLERDAVRKHQETTRAAREFAAEKARVEAKAKELEELSKVWLDADKNPERILELLEKHVGPDRLVKFFEDQSDPVKRSTRAAAEQAKEGLSPIEARLKAIEDENRALKMQGAQADAERTFKARVEEVAADAPLASRLMSRDPKKLIARAESLMFNASQPKEKGGLGLVYGTDYTLDNVIGQLEIDLKADADLYADLPAAKGETSQEEPTTQNAITPAAAKANTVSNRAASGRTTLDETKPRMSYDEKIKAAIRQARRT